MRNLIRTWLGRLSDRQGEYAVIFLDRLRGFARANVLTVAGILLALFAYYYVLDSRQSGETGDQFGNSTHTNQGRTLTSPDGRYAISIGPAHLPEAGKTAEVRRLTVRATGSTPNDSSVLGSVQTEGFVEARWSPSSRFVAIVTAPRNTTGAMTQVLAIGHEGSAPLSLPTSVDPEVLLAGEDAAAELQTGTVRLVEWRGDTLRVVSAGHGWVGPATEEGSLQVGIQCQFDLAVSASRIRELSRDC